MTVRRTESYERLSRWTEPAMLVLTLAFVGVALAGEVDSVSRDYGSHLTTVEWILWTVFPVEFIAMLALAPSRNRFFRERWWELPIMVLTVPQFDRFLAWLAPVRFVRVLRSARAVRAFRLTRLGGLLARYTYGIRMVLTRHGLQYVLAGAVLLYVISTFLVFQVERGGGRPIQSFGEALWWGITAITTLPDEGNVPVTRAGKGIAVFVVFLGLSLVSIITANIAAFLVRNEADADTRRMKDLAAQLDRIEQKLNSNDKLP